MSKESRLEILKGNEAGAQFRISGSRVLFGRASDCDVVITDSSVSRNHAEMIKAEGGYIVKDLKSSNGVFVNGKKEGPAREYYANGNLKSDANFSNDMQVGIQKWYYENGQIKSEYNFIISSLDWG